ncbi:MAG TPA: hypothetical protein VJM50_09040, partial [Pyrinomonadaceae bacterium]|nr:hypothetical protein [Pyrinomonadaceae bacterium]
MIASLLLALLVTFSGTVATYLYDEDAPIAARLCAGGALGLAGLGLVSFVVASFIGLSGAAVVFTTAICCSPLALLTDSATLKQVRQDLERAWNSFLRPELKSAGYFLFYAFVTVVLWRVFSRAVIEDDAGLSTGLLNNFGDLPFHISVITSFAFGNNFPPEDPTYAGVNFTYPFISDFVSAVFVRCGADLRQSMFIENLILGISFVGLVHRWALVMLRDSLAAIITPLLVLLNGGFGFKLLYEKAMANKGGLFGLLMDLPPSFTVIPETTWRWGNAISTLLIPQRGFLMGLPLATIAFTQWWLATSKERRADVATKTRVTTKPPSNTRFPIATRRMIAAGVAAGLLPLVHAHSFVVVMAMAGCLALIKPRWREWFAFFAVASAIAIPQLLWSTLNSAVDASSFFGWEVGWDHGKENPILFWFKNTGLFIPLIFAAILMKVDGYVVPRRLLLFYLPFTLCFIIPNFIKMAP